MADPARDGNPERNGRTEIPAGRKDKNGMNKEYSLEENVRHGTKEQPLTTMRFRTGKGTPYPDHFYVERHWHPNVEIIKIKKGSYKAEINLENMDLETGDLCMINSGELHLLEGIGSDTLHDVLIFDPQILSFRYEDEMQETLIRPLLSGQKAFPRVIRRQDAGYAQASPQFEQLIKLGEEKGENWYFQIKLEILRFVLTLHQFHLLNSSAHDLSALEKERIDRYKCVVSLIEENYASALTLNLLAQAARCNPQYLCRSFREIAGISPIQYLIRCRIQQAKHLLKNTTKTVLEISLECGFENVSYFIRQFKKQTGMTPHKFRSS